MTVAPRGISTTRIDQDQLEQAVIAFRQMRDWNCPGPDEPLTRLSLLSNSRTVQVTVEPAKVRKTFRRKKRWIASLTRFRSFGQQTLTSSQTLLHEYSGSTCNHAIRMTEDGPFPAKNLTSLKSKGCRFCPLRTGDGLSRTSGGPRACAEGPSVSRCPLHDVD